MFKIVIIFKDLTNIENPFTTQAIPSNVLTQLVDFIRLSNILKIKFFKL